jgi:hypothetical protein
MSPKVLSPNEEMSRDKFIACVFLQEWIPKGMES